MDVGAEPVIERPHSVPNEIVDDTPEFAADDLREMWILGSAPQLQRTYTQRCISCANWTAAKQGNHGTCSAIPDKANNDLIDVTGVTVTTKATYGCLLWAELDEDALHDRTDLAIKRNLMDDMPDDFDPGEPLKEQIRTKKAAVDGVAVAKSG